MHLFSWICFSSSFSVFVVILFIFMCIIFSHALSRLFLSFLLVFIINKMLFLFFLFDALLYFVVVVIFVVWFRYLNLFGLSRTRARTLMYWAISYFIYYTLHSLSSILFSLLSIGLCFLFGPEASVWIGPDDLAHAIFVERLFRCVEIVQKSLKENLLNNCNFMINHWTLCVCVFNPSENKVREEMKEMMNKKLQNDCGQIADGH